MIQYGKFSIGAQYQMLIPSSTLGIKIKHTKLDMKLTNDKSSLLLKKEGDVYIHQELYAYTSFKKKLKTYI
ncbi:hypothetical protein HanRHA438_Chr12g0539021 [Helianthus annuus]|nr:hypothetical protein HanRHA438_Chr12g0539021 [Helianthus annuus]